MDNATAIQNIQTLHARIDQLYQELNRVTAQLADMERSAMPDPAQEFHASYPDLQVPPELLALVGSHPARTIQQDKADLHEILAGRYSRCNPRRIPESIHP